MQPKKYDLHGGDVSRVFFCTSKLCQWFDYATSVDRQISVNGCIEVTIFHFESTSFPGISSHCFFTSFPVGVVSLKEVLIEARPSARPTINPFVFERLFLLYICVLLFLFFLLLLNFSYLLFIKICQPQPNFPFIFSLFNQAIT